MAKKSSDFLKAVNGFLYKPARILIPNPSAKDQRFVIVCYVHDLLKGKAVRKRYIFYDNITDKKKKLELLELACKALNKELADGGCLNGTDEIIKVDANNTSAYKKTLTLLQGMRLALQQKSTLRDKSYKNYKDYCNVFINWIEQNGYSEIRPDDFNKKLCDDFKLHLSQKGLANRTINNYIEHNQTLFNYIITIEAATKNPFAKVERLPVGIGNNVAYTEVQQKELMQFMLENRPLLLKLVLFMYYTMARPNEISHLKIKHIGFKAPNKIFLPEDFSKSVIERNITIPPAFREVIDSLRLDYSRPDDYIFSEGLVQGTKHINPNKFADYHREWVLKKILLEDGKTRKYDKDYTLYSWKHTSVVNNYRAGMSRAALKQQLGYRYDYSLEAYLKSLALIDEKELTDSFVPLKL